MPGTLRFDAAEIGRRRAYFEITDEDLARLGALRPLAESRSPAMVDAFYGFLSSHPETLAFLRDPATVGHLKKTQREYLLGLFAGRCDEAYVRDRLRVGLAHERIGLSMHWYLGAYRKYSELVRAHVTSAIEDAEGARAAEASLEKLILFDVALATDTYLAAKIDTIERQRAAVAELSTPVVTLSERILLLPLVGEVDGQRAEQVMQRVLVAITSTQARCLIIDVAGVPEIGTRQAADLTSTCDAVRLLGAFTILTGISPATAKTMVSLGVDFARLHTRATLAAGFALAQALVAGG